MKYRKVVEWKSEAVKIVRGKLNIKFDLREFRVLVSMTMMRKVGSDGLLKLNARVHVHRILRAELIYF